MVGRARPRPDCMQSAATIAADTATGSVNGFTYGDLALLVGAPRPRPAALAGGVPVPALPHRRARRLRRERHPAGRARRYEEVLAQRPQAGAVELDCFVNDSHMIRLPAWASGPDTTAAFQQGFRVVYEVDRASRSVTVLSAESNPHARTALMRVVRELAMNRSRARQRHVPARRRRRGGGTRPAHRRREAGRQDDLAPPSAARRPGPTTFPTIASCSRRRMRRRCVPCRRSSPCG